jgi:hypothetical protein
MRFYTERHGHTCRAVLGGRNLSLCMLDPDRQIVLHRRIDCDGEKLLRALAPYREDLVIGVACIFNGLRLTAAGQRRGRSSRSDRRRQPEGARLTRNKLKSGIRRSRSGLLRSFPGSVL